MTLTRVLTLYSDSRRQFEPNKGAGIMPRFTSYVVPNRSGGGLIVAVLKGGQVKVRLHLSEEVLTVPFDSLKPAWSARWFNNERDGLNNDVVRSKLRSWRVANKRR
jgi:hypothetical protein